MEKIETYKKDELMQLNVVKTMEIDEVKLEQSMERMIAGELSKAKEKRVSRIQTKNYSDLPKVNDP